MSFDWMDAKVGAPARARAPERTRDGFWRELRERAELLRRLGHDRATAERRCRQNLEWERDADLDPTQAAEVKKQVAAVYDR